MNNKHLLLVVLAGTLLGACAAKHIEGDLTGTVGSLYNEGMDNMAKGRYPQAIHDFQELGRQYPYSGWATRGDIMTAYAQLKNEQYDESLVTIDRFIKMHPGYQNLDYMYYLKGLNYYYQMTDVGRDQSNTEMAMDAFQEVVSRYPQSIYARDAKLKITLCRDHLAGKEMNVGRYYEQQKQYLSAINRFRTVVTKYQTTSQTPEALYRLTETYIAIGVTDEAVRAAAILGYNYPSSPWYAKAYALLTKKKLAPAGKMQSWPTRISHGFKDLFHD